MRAWHVLLALLLPLTALAQLALEQELLRLENERVDLFRSGKGDWGRFYVDDIASTNSTALDDFIGQTRDGAVLNLAQAKARKPDPQYNVADVKVYVYDDAALTTGVETPAGERVRFLRAWTKRPAGWRIVTNHGTPIIAPGNASDRKALATAKLSSITIPVAVSSLAREVLKIDEQYAAADRRNDTAGAKRLETDRFFFVSRTGNVNSPAGTPIQIKDLRMADVHVRTHGNSLAVVTGELQWTDQQGFSPGPLRFTRVWVKQAGQWKVAAEQRTSITARRTTTN
jgi:hypothetical protein